MRAATILLLAALAAPACAVDLPPLPANPGEAGDAPAADGPEGAVEAILPGVFLLEPSLDADTATAAFRVRNDTGGDLPDLILVAIFEVGPADGTGASLPRFETIEAPMRRGETRRFRATLATLAEGEQVRGLRVAAGVPQQVTAREEGVAGTTFLGGILECVALEADLTGPHRGVKVTLAVRGDAAADAALPALEAQLLCGRAGDLVWSGPWVLVPRGDPDGGMARRIRWNLDGAPGLGGCDVFLRVREKR
jgi:hypothetical protein